MNQQIVEREVLVYICNRLCIEPKEFGLVLD